MGRVDLFCCRLILKHVGRNGIIIIYLCECTTVERMDKATEILLNIVELYSK